MRRNINTLIILSRTSILSTLIIATFAQRTEALDTRGCLGLEQRLFFENGNQGEARSHPSVSGDLDIFDSWMGGDLTLNVKAFYRYDFEDRHRSRADLRVSSLTYIDADYEFKLGFAKEFWGVTESQNLVDIINQTDTMESVDDDVKLGQPMFKASYYTSGGLAEMFFLPYFRERKFPGRNGRLKPVLPISEDSQFEASQGRKHIDVALRYSHTLDSFDVGLSYFKGTSREPDFIVDSSMLTPYYALISQYGLDVQGIFKNTLVKLEAIDRRSSLRSYRAYTAGIEHTSVGIFNTAWNLDWLLEHLYDSRGDEAVVYTQNDVFLGLRVNPNNTSGSEALIGVFSDIENEREYVAKLEASSRLNSHWRFRAEAWLFHTQSMNSPLSSIKDDDFIQISFEYYF